jgi:hypothetical protein
MDSTRIRIRTSGTLALAITAALVAAPNITEALVVCNIQSAPSSGKLSTAAYVNPAAAVLGLTPAQVHARFAGIIEQNFRTGDANAIVHSISERELADLAAVYKNATSTPSTLLDILATRVDADGLAAVASAFGQEDTAAAVAQHAPAAIAREFRQIPVKLAAQGSTQVSHALTMSSNTASGLISDAAAGGPNVGMTPYEIYLEFRTAPFGSGSVLVALYEAAMFMGSSKTLAGAAATGAAIGTAVSYLIQTYDPTLDDAIGGTVSNMIDQMANATTELAAGQIQSAWDSLFSIPKVATPTTVPVAPFSSGDFGVATPLLDFTDLGGTLPSNATGGAAWSEVDISNGGGCP